MDIDLNNTRIQFDSNVKKFGSKATQNNSANVIRCNPGTSRNSRKDLNQSRGSMFQAPQSSNSVFRFQSSTEDANQSISADPAIQKRGPAHDSDENFFDDSNDFF